MSPGDNRVVRIPRGLLVLASVFLAAGCGQHVSRSGRTSELESYLNRVAVEQQRYQQIRSRTIVALTHASAVAPDDSWRKAARQLRTAEHQYVGLVARMTAIRAPQALQSEHAGMVESLQLYLRLVSNIERPLGKRDVVGMGRTLSMTTRLGIRANELRIRWRVAARATAERLGVAFPPTLDHVGRQLQPPQPLLLS
jgi:hypothetical protein